MDRLRVLHLLTSLGPGGAETNLLALLKYFDRTKYEHAIAFGGGGALEPEFSKAGVKLIRLTSKPLTVLSLTKLPSMIKKIDDFSPDIIHSHLDLPNIIGLMAKVLRRYSLILHFHGLAIIPRGQLPERSYKHNFSHFLAHSYRLCDRAISICKFQLPFLKRLGLGEEKIELIPNGINMVTASKAMKRQTPCYSFINIARFFPEKDHTLLVRAFHRVSAELPNVKLTLVGDGPLRQNVERLVKFLSLSSKVEFLGVRRDIPELLAISNCFVLSSKWELHPITILEAMRAGLPVIATNVGGVADTISNGISGLVVSPHDEDALYNAMMSLASNAEYSNAMGEQGYHIAMRKFNNEFVAKKIEAVYCTVKMSRSELSS